MNNDFGVALSAKDPARSLESFADFAVVEDLAVEHHGDGSRVIEARLGAGLMVDDLEATVNKPGGAIHEDAFVLGAPVLETITHPAQGLRIRRSAVKLDESGYPAHFGCRSPLWTASYTR